MDLQEQLAWFDEYAEQAYERVLQILVENRPLIIAKARFRLETIGMNDYGDASWHKQPNDLLNEALDEAADMEVYQVMQIHSERQGPEPDAWDEFCEEDSPVCFEADPRLLRALNGGPDD